MADGVDFRRFTIPWARPRCDAAWSARTSWDLYAAGIPLYLGILELRMKGTNRCFRYGGINRQVLYTRDLLDSFPDEINKWS